MKKTTFTLLLSLSCCWLVAQCPTGDITFYTQGQIDSFPINYPGCTDMPGSVRISGSDITNLQGLSVLDSIKGCLRIVGNPLLATLHGLENLYYVGECLIWVLGSGHTEGLTISGNAALTSLAGLNRLKIVKDGVSIAGNPAMTELDGLDSLSAVGTGTTGLGTSDPGPSYCLQINENKRLKIITGFASLDTLAALDISLNDSIVSLEGLKHLRAVFGPLTVRENYWYLKNFSGLDSLESVGYLWIEGNFSLENFHGLQNLKTIYSGFWGPTWTYPSFWVFGNYSLIDFSGLENFQEINGEVNISYNFSLQNLIGLGGNNILSFSSLTIEYNDNLSTCNTPPVCAYLENGGPATISNNALGCNSVPEVEAACIVPVEEASTGECAIVFSPNPASDFLQIQVNDNEKWEISLFDLRGRQMFRQLVSGSQIIEVKDWPSGIYALRAVSGERVFSGKIVKP